jgi:beta-galactosidase
MKNSMNIFWAQRHIKARFYFSAILVFIQISAFAQRQEQVLENGWRFIKGAQPGAEQTKYDDSKWQQVSVPHDWAISGPFDKEADKQVVAITQNGESQASEKTGRTGALP